MSHLRASILVDELVGMEASSSLTAAVSGSGRRPRMITHEAEAAMNALAVSRPIPEEDPVMRIVRPEWVFGGEEGSMAG